MGEDAYDNCKRRKQHWTKGETDAQCNHSQPDGEIGAGTALQKCPKVQQGDLAFAHPPANGPAIGGRLPPGRGLILGKVPLFHQRQFPDMDSVGSHQQPTLLHYRQAARGDRRKGTKREAS